MKSYTENEFEDVFAWKAFFLNKKKTKELIANAKVYADKWSTCPCGQLPVIIPRKMNGEPENTILSRIGLAFNDAMKEDFDIAHQLYDMINSYGNKLAKIEVKEKQEALKDLLKEQQRALNTTKRELKELDKEQQRALNTTKRELKELESLC